MEKPIYQAFVEFVNATFNKSPEELPLEQCNQLKMAFFGGAVITENLICNEIIAGSHKSAVRVMFTIQNELIEYGQQIDK